MIPTQKFLKHMCECVEKTSLGILLDWTLKEFLQHMWSFKSVRRIHLLLQIWELIFASDSNAKTCLGSCKCYVTEVWNVIELGIESEIKVWAKFSWRRICSSVCLFVCWLLCKYVRLLAWLSAFSCLFVCVSLKKTLCNKQH